jgi:hypothetical protein
MPAKSPVSPTIIVAGTSVKVTFDAASLDQLRLDPDNPRIRLQVMMGGRKKSQTSDELVDVIRAQPGYDDLHKQIRNQGGVHDPLIVRSDGRIVEGNTRFAVLTVLSRTPGGVQKWGRVPVMRLPKDMPEVLVQLLMADYHIAGKTTWRPAAQADQIYHLIEKSKATITQVADATRLTVKQVEQNLAAYKFLIKEVLPEVPNASPAERQRILYQRFSHALEFVTRKDLELIRKDPVARKEVASAIAGGRVQGAQVRRLPIVMKHAKAREALNRDGFKAAAEVVRKVDPTAESQVLKSIKKLTEILKNMSQKELELFQDHAKARAALQELTEALDSVVSIVESRKGKRRA